MASMTYNPRAGLLPVIYMPVTIRNESNHKSYTGILDTGASNTCVSLRVIDELGLVSESFTRVIGADGGYTARVFYVDVELPARVNFTNIKVNEAKLYDSDTPIEHRIDVLIGMDIITQGDFAITNEGGNTVCSFRTPSLQKIDFYEEERSQLPVEERIKLIKEKKKNNYHPPIR